MIRLYWKIFMWVWLTMVLIIVGTAFTSDHFLEQRLIPVRNSAFLTAYASAAVMSYESEGLTGLQFWFDELAQETGIQAYLIASDGASVTQDIMTQQVQEVQHQVSSDLLPNAAFRENNILVSKSVVSQDGQEYRLIADVPDPAPFFADQPMSLFWLRFILVLLISGVISYALARYLSGPIHKLKFAVSRISAGEFGTRVAGKIGERHDEIQDLAREFDKMAEKVQTLIETQQRLLRDVSHELRTPLARLQVALGLARRRTNGVAESELDRIELESERLNELIGEILSLVRMDATPVNFEDSVNLTHVLQDVMDDTNYEFKQLGTSGVLKTQENYFVRGNAALLKRAFENMIRNALRYTKPGCPVEIIIERVPQQQLKVSIMDRGPGVPEEALAHLFEPFFRVESSRKNDSGGYGIGLAIAEKAIKLHKGHVRALNRPDGGLCIELYFPEVLLLG